MTSGIDENRISQTWRGRGAAPGAAIACLTFFFLLAAMLAASGASAQELRERFAAHDPNSSLRIDNSQWDRLLKTYVRKDRQGLNRFDYAGLKASGLGALKNYLAKLQTIDPAKLARGEQFAFWTNLYNAKTVEIVTDHYPVKSIRDIRLTSFLFPGPWKEKVVKVAGVPLSLNDIEHGILRPIWGDPRIHYAVNCASVGCPNLVARAWTGNKLEKMLDGAARAYVNSSRGVRFEGRKVIVSGLYSWYADDFGGSAPRILAHLRKYAAPELAAKLSVDTQISDYDYNWDLNDVR